MLEEKINQDYVTAMKARDSIRSSTISFLRAQIKNVRIDRRLEKVEDVDVVTVIKKQIKQRQESIEQYKAGNRQDLADKESLELIILKSYLPEEISEGELKQIVMDAVKESQATSMKDMGKVMKVVMAKASGNADNKVVSELVKQSLSSL
jgi:uncharacterized protein YqeY